MSDQPHQAEDEAGLLALHIEARAGLLPSGMRCVVMRFVADPRAGSGALLTLADALREAAEEARLSESVAAARAPSLRATADFIAGLAPGRANWRDAA